MLYLNMYAVYYTVGKRLCQERRKCSALGRELQEDDNSQRYILVHGWLWLSGLKEERKRRIYLSIIERKTFLRSIVGSLQISIPLARRKLSRKDEGCKLFRFGQRDFLNTRSICCCLKFKSTRNSFCIGTVKSSI